MLSLYLLLGAAASISPAVGATCQPKAISLPYKSQRLVTGAEARGVLWQIGGSNPQNVTLMPSAFFNDTYLYGSQNAMCPSWTNSASCPTYRGGTYDKTLSSTKSDTANMIVHAWDNDIANWTRDDVKLQDGTTLAKHEFALRSSSNNMFVPKGEMGLGRSSPFLSSLIDQQKISSKSYSFFWGNEVTDQPRDGSLTLGGYDQALVGNSPNLTSKFDNSDGGCREGLMVNLTGLGIQTTGGEMRNVWEGLPQLKVCIVTTNSHIAWLPVQYWDPIQLAMGLDLYNSRNGTSQSYFWNTTIVKPNTATYSGNMTITLNDALTVTIPNKQLLFGEHLIADSGYMQIKNDIKQIPIARIQPNDRATPRLGGMFFSSAVLMVNHDKNEFTIAQAQPKADKRNIVAFDTANDCTGPIDAAAANNNNNNDNSGGSGGSGSTGNLGSSGPNETKKGLGGGAIAGIVIGVLAVLAAIAAIAFILMRRKRNAAAASPPVSEMAGFIDQPVTEKYGHNASEMYVDGNQHEMGHGAHFAAELDGSGRPLEAPGHGGPPAAVAHPK